MKILDALLDIKEQAIRGCVYDPHYGICYNLASITGDVDTSYDFVVYNCRDWEHFSGNAAFPVKYNHKDGLWEGEQLELRLSLIDHLIAKAKLLQV